MNIAFMVNQFPHLSETFILNMITGLLDRGHQVDIISTGFSHEEKQHPDIGKYGLLERSLYRPHIPLQRVKCWIKATTIAGFSALHNPTVIANTLFNTTHRDPSINRVELLFSTVPFLKRPHYDIVHCHFGPLGQLGAQLRQFNAFTGKVITSFHGYDLTSYLQTQDPAGYSHLFERGDYFLPISQHWQQRLVQLGCDETKIAVHHMGIDCQRFTFKPRFWQPDQPVQLISCCRLVEKKGIEYAIRAVAKVRPVFNQIRYSIIGDGPLYRYLEQLIKELNLDQHVELLGWRDQSELIQHLEQAHLFLAPSVTSSTGDQEGIPVALMEAMARGLPVLSTEHSGIPELIEDGVSGFLVPERDVEALANKLLTLVSHPDQWPQMGQAGRAQVEHSFNIETLNDQLVTLYQTVIEL